MTAFFKKKKKKKKKKDFSLNVIAKTYLQDFNFERYFLADGCLVKRFLIGGHLSRKLSKKTKSPVSYKSTINQFCGQEWCKNRISFKYYPLF